jgi:hypothetical protein
VAGFLTVVTSAAAELGRSAAEGDQMGEVVKTITSPSGLYRAEVIERPGGGFQVEVSRWAEEWVPGHGKVHEGWVPARQGLTLTDTVERAESLAAEKLRVWE